MTTSTHEVLETTELAELILSFVPIKDLVAIVPRVCQRWLALTGNPVLQEKLFFRSEKPKVQHDDDARSDTLGGLEPVSKESQEESGTERAGKILFGTNGHKEDNGDKLTDTNQANPDPGEPSSTNGNEAVPPPAEPRMWTSVGMFGTRSLLSGPMSYTSSTAVSFNPLLLQGLTVAERDSITDEALESPMFEIIHPPISQPRNAGFHMLLVQPAQNRVHVVVEVTFELRQRWQTWWEDYEVETCLQDSSGIRIGHMMEVIERVVDSVEEDVQQVAMREPWLTTVETVLIAVVVVDHALVVDFEDGYEFSA